ncbi:MAG: pyridoxamine 5'-phosphate oxidase [Pseudonocardia sp.]
MEVLPVRSDAVNAAPEDVRIAEMRVDYPEAGFDLDSLAPTWHEQLLRWLAEADAAGLPEPNAMVLATVDVAGRPSSRTVLCKGIEPDGVVFFTNYTSAKSHELGFGRFASATFPWYGLRRQVHFRGPAEQVSPQETARYWASRPRGSQLGAWASAQSTVVADRRTLDDALAAIARRFPDVEQVPVPSHWGGWRISPERVEFWQGRANRMHDRLRFERTDDLEWIVQRLAP